MTVRRPPPSARLGSGTILAVVLLPSRRRLAELRYTAAVLAPQPDGPAVPVSCSRAIPPSRMAGHPRPNDYQMEMPVMKIESARRRLFMRSGIVVGLAAAAGLVA